MMEVDDTENAQSDYVATKQTQPWTDKYRPRVLEDIVSQPYILQVLRRFIDQQRLTNLLFHGPPGTGKSTTMEACIRAIYGPLFSSHVRVFNASDERGIETVRKKIQPFVSTQSFADNGAMNFKMVVLDEADLMTEEAQNELKTLIEASIHNARYCFICNRVDKINPAVVSRCLCLRFTPLQPADMAQRLQFIANAEGVEVEPLAMEAIVRIANGDMRRAINLLATSSMTHSTPSEANTTGDTRSRMVGEVNVFAVSATPRQQHCAQILRWASSDEYTLQEALDMSARLIEDESYSLMDIFRYIFDTISANAVVAPPSAAAVASQGSPPVADAVSLAPAELSILVVFLSEAEMHLANGCNDVASTSTQLAALMSLFRLLRVARREGLALCDILPYSHQCLLVGASHGNL